MPSPRPTSHRARLTALAVVLAALASAALAPPALAATDVDLATQADARIDGAAAGDQLQLGGSTDVNGDGRKDLIGYTPVADNNNRTDSGSAWVVFANPLPSTLDLGSPLGTNGFRIDGASADSDGGRFVAKPAGDVNGDGKGDIVVGNSHENNNGRDHSGSAWVVFGKSTTTSVDLANLGTGGFRIDGAEAADLTGSDVAGAGDMNGDGKSDLIIGSMSASPKNRGAAGTTWVVFGKATSTNIDLANLGTGGFRIDGAVGPDELGRHVGRAGDVNGDGKQDVLAGAWLASKNNVGGSGSVYVIFGKSTATEVDTATLGTSGFRIDGRVSGGNISRATGLGDVNGDGKGDVGIEGTDFVGSQGTDVVFGKATGTTVDLASIGTAGYHVDNAGGGMAGVGDRTGDGKDDILVGAPFADAPGRTDSGIVYLLPGQSANTTIDVSAQLPAGSFRILGAAASEEAGMTVDAPGDLNNDGASDIALGAPGASHNNRTGSGSIYTASFRGGAPPAAPTLTGTDPASPANDNNPLVAGTAPADSTVKIYPNPSCTGTPAATGSAADFASPGLSVTVPDDSSTVFYATATDAANHTSDCSQSSVTYVEDSTPPPAPTFTGTDPASPANNNSPKIKGSAAAGSGVLLYTTPDCSGPPLTGGSAAGFASPGFTVTVADNSTTTFYATASDEAGNRSPCSTSVITYVEDSSTPTPNPGGSAGTGNPGGGAGGGPAGGGGQNTAAGTVTDKTGPTVVIPSSDKTLTESGGKFSFTVGPFPEDVTGDIGARSQPVAGSVAASRKKGKKLVIKLSTQHFQAKAGVKAVVTFKLSRKARKLLAKRKRIHMTATLTVRDKLGNPTVKTFSFTLKAGKKKHKR